MAPASSFSSLSYLSLVYISTCSLTFSFAPIWYQATTTYQKLLQLWAWIPTEADFYENSQKSNHERLNNQGFICVLHCMVRRGIMEWDQRDINFLQIYTWFQVFDDLYILGNTREITCEASTRGKLSRRVIQNNKTDNVLRAYQAATESRLAGQGGTGQIMLTFPGTMHKSSAYHSPLLSLHSRRECSMLVAQKDKIKARLFPSVEREVGPHSWTWVQVLELPVLYIHLSVLQRRTPMPSCGQVDSLSGASKCKPREGQGSPV